MPRPTPPPRRRRPARRRLARLLTLGLGLAAGPASAEPPSLTALEPPGLRVGSAVRVKAVGKFSWPTGVWADDPALIVIPGPEKGTLWIEAGAKARPGVHWIRLHDAEGASAPRPLVVGTLPEAGEVEPNDAPGKPQPIDRDAVTINGTLARNNDIDGYGLTLRKGQTLVASVEANRLLGSPMDGLLQVARPDGIVLAENDDDHGRDPQVVFVAPADGRYVVRVFAFPATPDSRIGYAGGPNYHYRLTLTTRAFVDHAYPLARGRDEAGPVRLEGWNIADGLQSREPVAPADGEALIVADPALANVAEVRRVEHPTAVEAEPNPPDAPQSIRPPVSVSGRIAEGRDTDAYRFSAKKGERLTLRVDSRTLGQPLDPALRVLDAAGKVVAEADDSGRNELDCEVAFNPPADGEYRAVVRDLNRQGGPRAAYLLTVAPPRPGYRLTVDNDRFTVTPGKPLTLTVKIDRRNGFDGPIAIEAEGLPAGVSAKPATSEPKGDTGKTVKLTVEAAVGADAASGPFRLVGRPKGQDGPLRAAEAKVEGLDRPIASLWMTVMPPPAAKPAK